MAKKIQYGKSVQLHPNYSFTKEEHADIRAAKSQDESDDIYAHDYCYRDNNKREFPDLIKIDGAWVPKRLVTTSPWTQRQYYNPSTVVLIDGSNGIQQECFQEHYSRAWYIHPDHYTYDFTFLSVTDSRRDTSVLVHPDHSARLWKNQAGDLFTEKPRAKFQDYHGARRPAEWRDRSGYGVENEVWMADREETIQYIVTDLGLICERDGSLDSYHGCEIIGGPLTLAQYEDDNNVWRKALQHLRASSAKGHEAGTGYGIHINVSKTMFEGTAGIARFAIANSFLSSVGPLVAQRNSPYQCSESWDYLAESALGGASLARIYESLQGKFRHVYAGKSHCVEVRQFRSTLAWDRFLARVQYCDAVLEWSKTPEFEKMLKSKISVLKGEIEFLTWLNSQWPKYAVLAKMIKETSRKEKEKNVLANCV